jgi:hypothetical protein
MRRFVGQPAISSICLPGDHPDLPTISRGAALAEDHPFMPSPSEQRLPFEAPIYEMEMRLGEISSVPRRAITLS